MMLNDINHDDLFYDAPMGNDLDGNLDGKSNTGTLPPADE